MKRRKVPHLLPKRPVMVRPKNGGSARGKVFESADTPECLAFLALSRGARGDLVAQVFLKVGGGSTKYDWGSF